MWHISFRDFKIHIFAPGTHPHHIYKLARKVGHLIGQISRQVGQGREGYDDHEVQNIIYVCSIEWLFIIKYIDHCYHSPDYAFCKYVICYILYVNLPKQ